MKVLIIRTVRDGVALTKIELFAAPRHSGQLLLEDRSESNIFNPIKRARLISRWRGVGDIDVIAPLFELGLVRVGEDRLMLVGYEVYAANGDARHVMQVWLVKPYD